MANQPKFQHPREHDLKFVRYSGLRPEDFGQEVKIVDSVANGVMIVAVLIGLLSVLAFFA